MALTKKEVDEELHVLRRLILNRLKNIKKQKFDNKAIDKFSVAFKVFLLRYLNLDYEFTLDELTIELNKTKLPKDLKEKIILISSLLTEIKYESKTISREEFKLLLKGAEIIINSAIIGVEEKIKKEDLTRKKRPFLGFLHKISLIKPGKKRMQKQAKKSKEIKGKTKRTSKKRKQKIKKYQNKKEKVR